MSDFLQIFYVSNARRFGFSKNVKLIEVGCCFVFFLARVYIPGSRELFSKN